MSAIKIISKCVLLLLVCGATIRAEEDGGFLERGYRALYRVYEECEHRNLAVSPCLKKKAVAFFERLGRIQTLPIGDNIELVKVASTTDDSSKSADLEKTLARTNGGAMDEVLNDILFERVAALMNSFNVQISLPKTNSGELKRSVEEGRGKMKKMMGMMMMGFAMKLAALVPIAMGVLFLLAGKALIISKIALVLSLIIGLKKLLQQKQGGHDHGGWQQSGGWDRSLKGVVGAPAIPSLTEADREYAHTLAYSARQKH
ncbi:PREDICTED: uncharacterized protein LOC105569116 [Vollenhovia emeryi]|uniref:uncharacterized protein LOC105569116 n=1 Tax=Vollenhovia emeryi TaxID=411798 RepID=UPI0005F48A6E|nr:PREDICTED: uncharacterized protein LOC105569116 [Vollenhovia emeryi]